MTRAAQLEASVSSHLVGGGTEIIELDGEFDASNSADFERRLSAAFGDEPTDVVVDLRGVRFFDSAALLTLRRGLTRAKQHGIGFALIRPNPLVWRVFVLTGFSDRFLTYTSTKRGTIRAIAGKTPWGGGTRFLWKGRRVPRLRAVTCWGLPATLDRLGSPAALGIKLADPCTSEPA